MERRQPTKKESDGGLYFKKSPTNLHFIRSGSTLLDLVNGGGWPLGRMTNIIGDKSTGKSLLAIEAFANFKRQYPKGKLFYRESEAAFDPAYGESIGMPVKDIDFGSKGQRWTLVEDIYADLKDQAASCKKYKVPGIYVIDSLDALSTKIDMEREFGVQTYRTDKPSQLGELFRKMTTHIQDAQIALVIISQVRAKIGVTFGDKTTRSGGAALDFYASIINKLAHLKQLKERHNGVERVTAVRIRVKNTKNKTSDAFRECEFNIRFGYGVNDAASCLEWLLTVNKQDRLNLSKEKAKKLLIYLDNLDKECLAEWSEFIQETTGKVWEQIEQGFRPKIRKYN